MAIYFAFIRKDPETCFGVDFPDFPGCITGGDTLEEAVAMAHEALSFHVRGMRKHNEEIPAPTPLEEILASEDAEGAVPVPIRLDTEKRPAVRINVTFEDGLLKAIDRHSAEHGLSRSAFLADAARRAMRETG